jgi:hypothetical protein
MGEKTEKRIIPARDRREFMKSLAAAVIVAEASGMNASAIAPLEADGLKPREETPNHNAAAPVPGDRWMEIDLYWFDRGHLQESVGMFWERFAPLYRGVAGDKGVILNVGWTVAYIMEWSGNLAQRISLPLGTGQQPWVAETSSLPGSIAERLEEWKQRFANPVMVQKKGYGPWTYGDLKRLAEMMRATAEEHGIHSFKVGSLVYAWDNAYGEVTPWAKRHPEAFTAVTDSEGKVFAPRFFNPANALHADPTPLGSMPHGFAEGMSVHAAFAAQWGSVSRAAGLNALMLRDSFGFPVPYTRRGPVGVLMPSREEIARATASVSALVRETKESNPAALLMMYSNAASAVGDWRCNGCDLERIAREGYLDIFVDQTWAGAWNEVGVRPHDFWNSPTLGWTYQLAYTLLHGAILAGTRVRHYPLVETFDAWESWDVLHTVPERLRWGIWAYSHAAVKTPHGLVVPPGSYISWANQGKRLLSADDVDFLRGNINAAVRDAANMKEVYGPTLVYSRSAMQWQIDHATRDSSIKEWIDEQAGSIMKWQVPVLSATRVEWLPRIATETAIVQTPSHLSSAEFDGLRRMIDQGRPVALLGSFAGGISPQLLSFAGLHEFRRKETRPSLHTAQTGDVSGLAVSNVAASFPVEETLDTSTQSRMEPLPSAAKTIYGTDGSAELVLMDTAKEKLVLWDPPEFSTHHDEPLLQIWGGSPAPYVLAAAAINALQREAGLVHVRAVNAEQTGCAGAWQTSDGRVHLLFGNLEEGLRNDADHSRHFSMEVPEAGKNAAWRSMWKNATVSASGASIHVDLAPDQSILLESETK